jgi:threonine/homoserine/homoserine lactone efflux protein
MADWAVALRCATDGGTTALIPGPVIALVLDSGLAFSFDDRVCEAFT